MKIRAVLAIAVISAIMVIHCTRRFTTPEPGYLRVWIEGEAADRDVLGIQPGDCLNLKINNIRVFREDGYHKPIYWSTDVFHDTDRVVNIFAWDTTEDKFKTYFLGETDLPPQRFDTIKVTINLSPYVETTYVDTDTVVNYHYNVFKLGGHLLNIELEWGTSVAKASFDLQVEEHKYYDLYLYFDIDSSLSRTAEGYEIAPVIKVKSLE
ncbi:hypothetical protein J7J56_02345 [candidate division WOR-3 bacterium]|nr:hypothetical protein [candidate division WOR-3 bacterium]